MIELERETPVADVAVLGPVGLMAGTVFVAPSAQAMRTMLGVLAVAPGRELSAEALFARLWGDSSRASSRSALTVAVYRLRRWLEETAGNAVRVDRTPTGYRLVLTTGETDYARFSALVAEAAATGPSARAAVLERALAMWRGRPLADLPDEAVDEAAVAELDHLHRRAQNELGRTHLVNGEPEKAVRLLRPVVRDRPLDEDSHGVLIEALAAAGYQVEALNTYEALRARLAGELGVDPSAPLQRTYLKILHQQIPVEPVAPAVLAQLPAEPTGFTGREDALRSLDKLLREAKADGLPMVAAVVGMAGVGKTALAVRWAHQVAEEFPDGQLYVSLRGYSRARPLSAREALGQLLRSLGMPGTEIPVDDDEAAAEFRSRVSGRRLLILLDNARSVEQVRPLLAGAPSCCTLVTSREQLNGLTARDGARRVSLDILARGDAVRLLEFLLGDRARREPAAVAELASLCGGLPLALRIAAAILDNRPEASIVDQVAELRAGNVLSGLEIAGDAEGRMRAAFDLSCQALSPPARRLFGLLGLVPGADFSTPAVAALAGVPVRRELAELVSAHVVERHEGDRFGFHDLLAQFAREKADELSMAAAIRRLTGWYLGRTEAAMRIVDPHGVRLPAEPGAEFGDRREALAWLDSERANVVAVVENGPADLVWRLGNAVAGYLQLRTHTLDAYTVAQAGLATVGPEPRAGAALRLDMARACQRLSRYEEAIGHGRSAAALSAEACWPAGESSALAVLGSVLGELGRIDEAIENATRGWEISRGHGLSSLEGHQLNDLGIAHLWLGGLAQAEAHFAKARQIHRETGSPAGENISTISLAQLSLEAGRLDVAIGYLASASELVRREGRIIGWPRIFNTLAAVHNEAGRFDDGLTACRTALPVAEHIGDRAVRCSLLNNLGDAYLGLARYDECAAAHLQAAELAKQAGLVRHQGGALLGLARCSRLTGDVARAKSLVQKALLFERASRRVWREGQALTELAACELAGGEAGSAAEHARAAAELHHRAGHELAEARALEVLAAAGG
ncbi:AfsR/SARP family transcriptional regulator [Amycolatopsis sp.]|uniref:AfsR/SARP family transcriptional regulator n=1 Tax=Amycolatopsis sp. TaxID=37632 RepID=UPI002C347A97|nr:BTAD domain-containing putative transcriptional regulator [Amycolatopsis sp.]HVV14707.1 BTAD domain-containing putative transcriptional regulator [Amycolatopsis sp.]